MTGALAARAAVAVLALVGGATIGCAAVVLHRYWWGLLLGVAATAALLVAIPGGWWRRLPFALGWVAAVLVLTGERPEGDLLVTQTATGYLLLAAGLGVLLGGVVGLRRHPAADPSINDRGASTS
ncbi:hypothetical protein [Nocardioides antri]|uniref:Uncharacterized protein n=1 Tax=Nocardioides antri TaxID=2607659 RepID=A0A5B1LZF8_9ACTN|nr:hypothetical protein [Nocardioides antri]KAA1426032.1 hypothetical protein F0U47_17000 [Nocardioides antri]